jgi:hypothetical protein
MSKQQYNLHTKTDYLNRKMFLDPAGPVTIQRFEEVKYKKIADFETTARGSFGYQKKSVFQKMPTILRMPAMRLNIYSPVICLGKLLLTVCKAAAQVKSLLRS